MDAKSLALSNAMVRWLMQMVLTWTLFSNGFQNMVAWQVTLMRPSLKTVQKFLKKNVTS